MSRVALGAMLGLVLAAAVLLLARYGWGWRAPRLADRIGPYVAGLRTVGAESPGRTFGVASLLPTGLGRRRDDARLVTRLRRAGLATDVPAFRVDQLAWAAAGACAGATFGLMSTLHGSASGAVVVLAVAGGAAGAVLRDVSLSRQVRRRQQAIETALPALADLVALSVTSGAAPVASFERAAAAMSGPLADEVAAATAAVRSGMPADAALRPLGDGTGVPALGRLVDALLLSVERGSPLADIARAQAADVRAGERRRLLELAGRKDVLMLVPIVFLVLPSVVLVAVFPGIAALRLVVP